MIMRLERSSVDLHRRLCSRTIAGCGAPSSGDRSRAFLPDGIPYLAFAPAEDRSFVIALSTGTTAESTDQSRTAGPFPGRPTSVILRVTQMNEQIAVMLLLV